MKAIIVMFDSLNRHMPPTYGCGWVHAPNFQRQAQPERFERLGLDAWRVLDLRLTPADRRLAGNDTRGARCEWHW